LLTFSWFHSDEAGAVESSRAFLRFDRRIAG
jgi:hypothetical protein